MTNTTNPANISDATRDALNILWAAKKQCGLHAGQILAGAIFHLLGPIDGWKA